jgi:hypothetical protein
VCNREEYYFIVKKIKKMNEDKNCKDDRKDRPHQLMQLFINDLQINSDCRTNAKYMENKQREWAILKKKFHKQIVFHSQKIL